MGHGSYTAADWSRLRTSRKMDSSVGEKELYVRSDIDPRFDPKYIRVREARDSEDHPNSTPVIIGLDVTASMGYLSNKIAREALNETMMKLYATKPIEDPQLLFAAYGDYEDGAPLQVTQFESDIRIAEQLLDLWLESRGSGMVMPNLLWHFAAAHTELDCVNKRGKKGFLFTIGDNADCRMEDRRGTFSRVFNEQVSVPTSQILKAAQEKFEVFHICIGAGARTFAELLPGRLMVIDKDAVDALPEIIISAMQIAGGTKVERTISQWSGMVQPLVRQAVSGLTVGSSKRGFFF